ncbi:MAG: EI24 domain-containing protein [Planctomycetes bacterium]|nr:EI24 domain-containing protein [Planctomycetota bacterium]
MIPNPNPCAGCGYPAADGNLACGECGAAALSKPRATFGTGFRAYFEACGFLLRTPRTKRYAVAPTALAVTLSVPVFAIGWNLSAPLRHVVTEAHWLPDSLRAIVAFVLGTLVLLVLAIVVFFSLAPLAAICAAPFLDILVGRVDEVSYKTKRELQMPRRRLLIFMIAESLHMLWVILFLNAVAFVCVWLAPVGPFISFIILSCAAGLGALDIATARRGFSFSQKLIIAKNNFGAMMGLGTVMIAAASIPCAGWVITIPVSAVAGAILLQKMRIRPEIYLSSQR